MIEMFKVVYGCDDIYVIPVYKLVVECEISLVKAWNFLLVVWCRYWRRSVILWTVFLWWLLYRSFVWC